MIWILPILLVWFLGAVVTGRLNRGNRADQIADWIWPVFALRWLVEKALTFPRWLGEKL